MRDFLLPVFLFNKFNLSWFAIAVSSISGFIALQKKKFFTAEVLFIVTRISITLAFAHAHNFICLSTA